MFYSIENGIREIGSGEIGGCGMTVGYIEESELEEYGAKLGLTRAVPEQYLPDDVPFRTNVEIHHDYTYTQMRILSEDAKDDCIELFVKKDMLLVVNVCDLDGSIVKNLEKAMRRIPSDRMSIVRVLCSFIDTLLSGDNRNIELMRNEITGMEEDVIKGKAGEDLNIRLLEIKKNLLKYHNYYEQLIDIAEAIEENENDIFEEQQLIYASNLTNRLTRLKESIDSLRNSSDHLQDAYSATLDMKLNNTMKVFTVITSIFFPLTIIVGWYGMNFSSMPEFAWKYGYVYVISLSVLTVVGLIILCKKKKWF